MAVSAGGGERSGGWRPVARTEEALLQRNEALRVQSSLPADTPPPAHCALTLPDYGLRMGCY
ncbi:hypothetical protein ACFW7J_21710 [Streptomyces sp. NPDC059525]|uniref:hypothetical protein n=1 Tax=Streptomyces sp. NPDC059525 TaxID=3346857 RepID=UPI0036798FF0